MPTANRDASVVDVGPGLLYIGKAGTTEPTDITDLQWPVAWVELGYTDAGSTYKVEPTVDDIDVAEERDAVATTVSKVKSTLSVALAQITAFNLSVAMGGGTITTATGLVTFEPPDAGTEQEVKLGWRSAAKDEAMIWRRCKATGSLNLDRKPGNSKATIPVDFQVLVPTGADAGKTSWKWFGLAAKSGPADTLIYA